MVVGNVGHGQAVDIIAARGEQAGDAGQDTRLVRHRQRQDVPLALFFVDMHQMLFPSSISSRSGRGEIMPIKA